MEEPLTWREKAECCKTGKNNQKEAAMKAVV